MDGESTARMFTELRRLGSGWTERCGGEKTSSCKKSKHSLTVIAMDVLRVVLFDV